MSAVFIRSEGMGRNAVTVSQLSPEELAAYRQKYPPKEGTRMKGTLTVPQYMKFKENRMTDSAICKELNWNAVELTKWKDENLTPEQRASTRLSKSTKTPAERLAESKGTNTSEPEESIAIEATDAPETPMVKVEPDDEVKEQILHIVNENNRLSEKGETCAKEKAALEEVVEKLRDRNEALINLKESATESAQQAHAKIKEIEKTNEIKLIEMHSELASLRDGIQNRNAEIGALRSNNEDLQRTVEKLRAELAEIKQTPAEFVMDDRVQAENAALKTLVKLYI